MRPRFFLTAGTLVLTLGFPCALLVSSAAQAQTAGQACQPFGKTVMAQDKMSMLACLYTKPYPEGSVQPAPPLVWKLNTSARPAGITGGCTVTTGQTKFAKGATANALTVETKWGSGCRDGSNGGINDEFDVCNYAADIGYLCGTISPPVRLPAHQEKTSPPNQRTIYICACVQQ